MEPSAIEEVGRIARTVAATISTMLEARLVAVYGDDWLTAVNEHRAAKGVPAGRRLADHRFCLSVFGFDPATQGWIHEDLRRMARELAGLARKAAHDDMLTEADVRRARDIADAFQRGAGTTESRHDRQAETDEPVRGKDLFEDRTLTALQARIGLEIRVHIYAELGSRFVPKTVTARLPPNRSDGDVVRVRRGGLLSENGGQPGDLLIRIRVE